MGLQLSTVWCVASFLSPDAAAKAVVSVEGESDSTEHLFGGVVFTLSVEWISSNLGRGFELGGLTLVGDNCFIRAIKLQAKTARDILRVHATSIQWPFV